MWGGGCGGGRPGRDGADACASDEGHRGWEVCSGGGGGGAWARGGGRRGSASDARSVREGGAAGAFPRIARARAGPGRRRRERRGRAPRPRGREPAGAFSIISLRPPRDRRARGEARTFGASGTCGVTSAGVALLVLGASRRARKCRAGARERALRDVGGKISRSALERGLLGPGAIRAALGHESRPTRRQVTAAEEMRQPRFQSREPPGRFRSRTERRTRRARFIGRNRARSAFRRIPRSAPIATVRGPAIPERGRIKGETGESRTAQNTRRINPPSQGQFSPKTRAGSHECEILE